MFSNQNKQTYLRTLNITAAFLAAVMFVLFPACSGKDKKLTEAISENDNLPSMKSLGVTTLISDSGITRYKIVAEEWLIYDKKNPPYSVSMLASKQIQPINKKRKNYGN